MNIKNYRPTGYEFELIRAIKREDSSVVSKSVLQTALTMREPTLEKTINNAQKLGYVTITENDKVELQIDPVREMHPNTD